MTDINGHSQKVQATVWKLTQDLIALENDTGSQLEGADTAMTSTIVKNSNTQNPPILIRPYRKVHTHMIS